MGSIISRHNCPCCGSGSIVRVLVCKDHTVSKEQFDIVQCDNCMVRFTQDVPDQHAIGAYYQSEEYISHTDTGKGAINRMYNAARNYTLGWKMNLVRRSAGKAVKAGSLLDIGSGTGAFLHKAHLSGWSVKGIEPDEGARKICRDKYGLEPCEPASFFELPSASFDIITMWHVLEHVHELHEYLDQIRKLMKQHGMALIALPNYTSKDAKVYKEYWAAYDVPRHLYHFSPQALSRLSDQHQLKLHSIRPMWLDAFYISLLSEEYKNGKSNFVSALWNGARSNFSAVRNKLNCSSLVYLLQHKS